MSASGQRLYLYAVKGDAAESIVRSVSYGVDPIMPVGVGLGGGGAGTDHVQVAGDLRPFATVGRALCKIDVNDGREYRRITDVIYDPEVDVTMVMVDAVFTSPAPLFDLELSIGQTPMGRLAHVLDDEMHELVTNADQNDAAINALRTRLNATISDTGTATTLLRPEAEFLLLEGVPVKIGSQTFALDGEHVADFAVGRAVRLTGATTTVYAHFGAAPTLGGGATVGTLRAPLLVPDALLTVAVSRVADSDPFVPATRIPDHEITPAKLTVVTPTRSELDAMVSALTAAYGPPSADILAEGGAIVAHGALSFGAHTPASTRPLGTAEMVTAISTHNTSDPGAHLRPGGSFTPYERRVMRGAPSGFCDLDADAKIPYGRLVGHTVGVKRVVEVQGSLAAGFTTIPGAGQLSLLLFLPADLNVAKSFCTFTFYTTASASESTVFCTAELVAGAPPAVLLQRMARANPVVVSVIVTEFY